MSSDQQQYKKDDEPVGNTSNGVKPSPWEEFYEHPYSICWRMGGGEDYIMHWWDWWRQQSYNEEQKIQYFLDKKPFPHCWLSFVVDAIWDKELEDGHGSSSDENELDPEIASCFNRLHNIASFTLC